MKSLYERLGSTDGIRQIVETVAESHLKNPKISARFMPLTKDPAKLETALRHLTDFMVTGSGGPPTYTGRSMEEAHFGMNISDDEYMSAIDDIMGALVTHGKDETVQKDVLFILYQLRSPIVRQ